MLIIMIMMYYNRNHEAENAENEDQENDGNYKLVDDTDADVNDDDNDDA